jgi:hypothetical protein
LEGKEIFMNVGDKHWAVTEGWIPPLGDKTLSLLNVSGQTANVQLTVYYSDRDPVGPYRLTVPAERLRRIRFDRLKEPEPIPHATEYAMTVDSDVPIVVQQAGFVSSGKRNA